MLEWYILVRNNQSNREPMDWDEVDYMIEEFKKWVNEYEGNT